MEITKWPAKATLEKRPGMMVRVTEQEALQLICSLSDQLLRGNPNCGRAEFTTTNGAYFSIAVELKEVSKITVYVE